MAITNPLAPVYTGAITALTDADVVTPAQSLNSAITAAADAHAATYGSAAARTAFAEALQATIGRYINLRLP